MSASGRFGSAGAPTQATYHSSTRWGRLQDVGPDQHGGGSGDRAEHRELSTWDVLRVAPKVIRSFEAGPEDFWA